MRRGWTRIVVHAECRRVAAGSLAGCDVVIVDTLRATSTIVAAVAAGAVVEPVRTVAGARRRAAAIGARALLAGERGGLPIAGFAAGNSPVELRSAAGRRVVLTTSNGTLAVRRAAGARRVFAGALTNAPALAHHLLQVRPAPVLAFLCAGQRSGLAVEDLVGAGAVIAALLAAPGPRASDLGDTAGMCRTLFQAHRRRLGRFLAETEGGRLLIGIGAARDVAHCARLGRARAVPRLERGAFVEARRRAARP